MSDLVTRAFVEQYSTNVQLLLQQEGSRLRPYVQTGSHTGKTASPVEQVGAVTAIKRTTRHADTPLVFTPHQKRWCSPVDYEIADLVDDPDQLRMLIDPKSPIARTQANAIGRAMDTELILAGLGSATIGEPGATTTETFDATNYRIVHGSQGMTVAKLRGARRRFMGANLNMDTDMFFVAMTAIQFDDLLSEVQTTSLDYNTKPVLTDGKIANFMGFTFVHTELLPKAATIRSCMAWSKSGLHLGLWKDVSGSIDKRPDKSNSMQVYTCGTVGATRLEQGRVVEIQCTET
jgi:hypothetical protein